jgi:hypothetical protein
MWAGIFGAISQLLAIVLKLFGYGEAASAKKKAYQQAVINEALKYENTVDTASNVREEHKKLNPDLNAEWEKKFNPKPPVTPKKE